jgi:hypothetical protein
MHPSNDAAAGAKKTSGLTLLLMFYKETPVTHLFMRSIHGCTGTHLFGNDVRHGTPN